MKCPICGQKLVCGCESCQKHSPAKEDEKYSIRLYDICCEQCSNCGFTQGLDSWLNDEIKQLKEEGLWPIK